MQNFNFTYRLTFYICSVGFSTPMLFENLKNPYHLMLQEFQKAGGLEALFKYVDIQLFLLIFPLKL